MKRYAYGAYPPPILPGMEDVAPIPISSPKNKYFLEYEPSSTKEDPFFLRMCECCQFTSKWQMPIVSPVVDTSILTREIMGYDRISNPRRTAYGIHFYCADTKILSSLRSYLHVFNKLKSQPFIIGPDYSIRMNMPFPQKLGNSFYIKLVTAWYQYMGSITVPNIVWADETNLEAYMDGYPKYSIIAINSTGVGRDKRAIYNWMVGYQYAIEVLQPLAIIRYGVKVQGEIESISYYKKNDNFKSCNYGW